MARKYDIEVNPKVIKRFRKIFNGINSVSIIDDSIEKYKFTIPAEDDYHIPMTRFSSTQTIENSPVFYFIHGGAFLAGGTEIAKDALELFVSQTKMIAVSIDYRLSPENPFPIGHTDCYTGLRWLVDHVSDWGADKHNIFVGGDSAGGNLTAYCCNRNIEEKRDDIAGQILLYPTLNMGGTKDKYTSININSDVAMYEKHVNVIKPSIESFEGLTFGLSKILGTTDTFNKYLSPYVSVSRLNPVTFISSSEYDYLTFESLAYANEIN